MRKNEKRMLLFSALLLAGITAVSGQTPDIRFTNVGRLYVATNGSGNASLYVPASVRMLGSEVEVLQNGLTALGGDFVNDVTSGNIFDGSSSGWYLFCGSAAQSINGSASKRLNYIDFPNVETFNRASVSLDALMAMSVDELKLSEGKFVLKSCRDASEAAGSQLAHLLVKDHVSYTRNAATPQQNGVVEIELYLGDDREKRFFGWTSPYRVTYSDYLFYNYLTEPTGETLFGDLRQTITNAEYPLRPGRGYLIGQGVYSAPAAWTGVDPRWPDALYDDRFTDTLTFNRYTFNDIRNKTIAVASNRDDSYTGEELNTESVTVHLNKKGYHFLGNPYTCPLDMNGFVSPEYTGNNAWGVSRGDSGNEDVYNMFWVISQGNAYNVNEAEQKFSLNVTYLVGQEAGSTLSAYSNDGLKIAPMQLFVVYSNKEQDFTIPKIERTHGSTSFLRSAAPSIDNELLLEVRDSRTGGFDRACVVFRPGASPAAIDRYDANKLFNRSGGVNQIWLPTGSDNGDKNLSVSVVPYETPSLEMAWLPSETPQQCTLTAYRQESLTAPEGAVLEDRQTGVKTDLFTTPDYTFQSSPADRSDRFVLHFKPAASGTGNPVEGSLTCRYDKQGKAIRITGLSEKDASSTIRVYDVQGRRMLDSPVGDGTVPFSAVDGIYLVKVTGNRMLNAKIVIR
jgi:hypothetical protein